IDWTQPLTAWTREMMAEFLITAMRLIRKAQIARDISDKGITRQSSANTIARQANAGAGGPLMTPDEFNDEIGNLIVEAFRCRKSISAPSSRPSRSIPRSTMRSSARQQQ